MRWIKLRLNQIPTYIMFEIGWDIESEDKYKLFFVVFNDLEIAEKKHWEDSSKHSSTNRYASRETGLGKTGKIQDQ